jgi:hypothetical protein
VYWRPAHYLDTGEPQLLELRGNFLDLAPPRVKVDGQDAAPLGSTSNALQVSLPPPAAPTTASVERVVTVECTSCEPRTCLRRPCEPRFGTVPSAVAVTMRPRVSYSVSAEIRPHGRQKESATFTFSNYLSDDDCEASWSRTFGYCLTSGWSVTGGAAPEPVLTAASCGSGAYSQLAGSACVDVVATVKGCGKRWIVGCKGRGAVGFNLSVPATREVEKDFAVQTFAAAPSHDRTFTFSYGALPPESRVDRWEYRVKIRTSTGKTVELSHATASVPEAHASMAHGTLQVTIDDPGLVAAGP